MADNEAAAVVVYTDGGCRGNPGPGAWAALLRYGEHERELSGTEPITTNNRMELMGAIVALETLTRASRVVLYTDSQYVKKGMTEWLRSWVARGWLTADRKPVKNADLWQRLQTAAQRHQVDWRWVRGHAGDPGNERVDLLANQAMDKLIAQQRG
jgi:ribonuclease HI